METETDPKTKQKTKQKKQRKEQYKRDTKENNIKAILEEHYHPQPRSCRSTC